jgi:hypothetical protein
MGEPFFLEHTLTEREKYLTTVANCLMSTHKFNLETLRRYLTGFIRISLFKESIQGAANLFKVKGFDDAYVKTKERLQEIEKATFEDDAMVIRFINPELWLADEAKDMENAISTGSSVLDGALGGNIVEIERDGKKDKIIKGGMFKGEATAILAPTNTGKCLGKDTPVLMFDGTVKNVQDVVVGDQLMGPDSKPRLVLGTTIGYGPLYKITPNAGGISWICNDVHVLSLKAGYNNGYRKKGDILNISLNEYLQKCSDFKRCSRMWRTAIDFKEKRLEIPPYILGLWLGDGNSDSARFTTMDNEVVEAISSYADEIGCHVTINNNTNSGRAKMYAISNNHHGNPFLTALRGLGLINNKHIPHQYLTGSTEQRLQLLAGLIDTDGYISNGIIDFVQKSKILADNVAFLARSLGFKVTMKNVIKTIKSIGFTGNYFRLTIAGAVSCLPLRIKRKRNKSDAKKNPLTCGFSVDFVGKGKYYGFELGGDHLFLLGDFTVTHNTTLMLTIARHAIYQGKKVLLITHEGKPTSIRRTILASMMGMNKRELLTMSASGTAKILDEVSKYIEDHMTYIHYSKALEMYVEDVVAEIRKRDSELRLKTGKGYDLIIDDYPAKLKSRVLSKQQVTSRVELAYIYDAFNMLASELKTHCLVAAQTNREGYKANRSASEGDMYLDIDSISESYGIGQNIANMLSLNRSNNDKRLEILHLTVIKSRDNITHQTIHTRTDYGAGLTHGDSNMFDKFGSRCRPVGHLIGYLDESSDVKKSEDVDAFIKSMENDAKVLEDAKSGAFNGWSR